MYKSYVFILYSLTFSSYLLSNQDSILTPIQKNKSESVLHEFVDHPDSLTEEETSLFKDQLDEAKILLSDAIVSDNTSDTISALYNFKLLFETLAEIDEQNHFDEFEEIEFNKFLTTAVDYYEKKALSINKIETGLSVALLRDRLDEYTYSQSLEDLEFVDETVEIIDGHIPITYNRKVSSIIKFFQNQGRPSIQKWLNRSDKFKKIILPILEEEDVPPELFYLAMIESGLNPNAYSYAHASGIWQFISSTGKEYDLEKNWYIDERLDFEKATRSAATYLKDLHREFDDWYLAFAAYNSGSGRVKRAIRRHDSKDYWRLTTLPKETRNYVPNIMAAIFISMNPEKYGFTVSPDEDFSWEVIEIDKRVTIEQISECSDVPIKTLRYYNPELIRGTIPPLDDNEVYNFRLPTIASEKFDSLFSLVRPESNEAIEFATHKIKYGENLSLISKKYNVPIRDIVSYNKIKNPNKIKPKTYLTIPISGYQEFLDESITENKNKKVYYTVKAGDSLSEIAEMYKTSIKNIKRWNGLRNDIIRIGQKLEIWTNQKNKKNHVKQKKSNQRIYYTVKYGDTISGIAVKYGVSSKKIKTWNALKSDKIKAGDRLIIWSNI